jgi:hypothetical protein
VRVIVCADQLGLSAAIAIEVIHAHAWAILARNQQQVGVCWYSGGATAINACTGRPRHLLYHLHDVQLDWHVDEAEQVFHDSGGQWGGEEDRQPPLFGLFADGLPWFLVGLLLGELLIDLRVQKVESVRSSKCILCTSNRISVAR